MGKVWLPLMRLSPLAGMGTLRAVASRCLEVRGEIPPLLPVPMGTANLMGRYLGVHWQAGDLAQRVVQSIQAAVL